MAGEWAETESGGSSDRRLRGDLRRDEGYRHTLVEEKPVVLDSNRSSGKAAEKVRLEPNSTDAARYKNGCEPRIAAVDHGKDGPIPTFASP